MVVLLLLCVCCAVWPGLSTLVMPHTTLPTIPCVWLSINTIISRVSRIPHGSTVLPAICTEEVITLGAELEDGTVIRGQNNISHPTSCSDSGGGEQLLLLLIGPPLL